MYAKVDVSEIILYTVDRTAQIIQVDMIKVKIYRQDQ